MVLNPVLSHIEGFRYLRVFMSEGKLEHEIDRWTGSAFAVMQSVCRTFMVKRELSRKANLSVYRSPMVMNFGTRSLTQVAKMSFHHRGVGDSLRDKLGSSVTREELGV